MLDAYPIIAAVRLAALIAQATPEPGGSGRGGLGDGAWAVIASVVAGGLALLGAWLGHRWTENSALRRERATEEKQGKAVRRLLRFEMDANLGAMLDWWKSVSAVDPEWDQPDEEELAWRHAEQVVRNPLPPTSNRMWEAQAGLLALALKDEQIGLCQRHYAGIEALHARCAQLVAAHRADEDRQKAVLGPGGAGMYLWGGFRIEAQQRWPRVRKEAEALLALGIPLPPED